MYLLAGKIMLMVAERDSGVGVNVSCIMHQHKIPRSTFQRHLRELVDAGMLVRVGQGRYSVPLELVLGAK